MNDFLLYASVFVTAIVGGYALVITVLDRRVDDRLFYGVAVLELFLVVMLVWGIVDLVGVDGYDRSVDFVAYLITALFIAPAALLWGIAEKSRWGSGVLLVGILTVAVLIARLDQLWPPVR